MKTRLFYVMDNCILCPLRQTESSLCGHPDNIDEDNPVVTSYDDTPSDCPLRQKDLYIHFVDD